VIHLHFVFKDCEAVLNFQSFSYINITLPVRLVEFGTQSLADEVKQALEEEGLEDLGEETKDEEEQYS